MSLKRLLTSFAVVCALASPGVASASDDDAHRTFATFDLLARNQPLAAVLRTSIVNEFEYMRDNVSPFFDPVWLRARANFYISPAYAGVGADIEWSPIRLFEINVGYLANGYFGSLYYIYSFDERNPVTDDDGIDELDGLEESGFMHSIHVAPTFQLAFGNIAVQNKFRYVRNWFPSDTFDGPYVREPFYDRLQAVDGDSILVNQFVVLYKVWDPDGDRDARMLVGPFHEWVRGVHLQSNRHRVGLTYVLIPKARYGKLEVPRLLLQAGFNVVDRSNNRDNHFFVQGSLGFNLTLKD